MSINVTVSGNPVNIKRGKMVTSDPYSAKKEFDKRRLLRLEQVRQQSKELAEDVRNKVRREKKKQMGEIEKEGKEKLKSWQNRKLLELQNQYREALDEIGAGHKEAEQLENESEIMAEQSLKNEELAQKRGRLAETKLQVQKNEDNYKKAMPIQHKKLVRDIENTRAALVSGIKQNKKCQSKTKKPKTKADINITIPDDSDFDEESETESSDRLPSIQEEISEHSEGFCECSECSDEKISSDTTPSDTAQPIKTSAKENYPDSKKIESKHKSYQETIDERRKLIEDFRNRPRDVPLDTRISDRIKRRQYMASQPDFCDEAIEPAPILEVKESTQLRDKIGSRPNYFEKSDDIPVKDPLELSNGECICSKFHTCSCKLISTGVQTDLKEGSKQSKCSCSYKGECKQSKNLTDPTKSRSAKVLEQKESKSMEKSYRPENIPSQRISNNIGPSTEIPSKPSVKLKEKPSKSEAQESHANSGVYRVRHYDFTNRFERDMPSTSQVEKITADSLEVNPNISSEAEWYEKMKQRDQEAQKRGKRALEKEKVQRDYEEMMKKLPVLQRKDHIAQIGMDKPEYHMSEERLKQRERERQNRLENAYTQAIPDLKPQIITIPSRKYEIPKTDEPFEILDGDDSRTLNLGKWDIETKPKKMFSAEEVQEIIKSFTVQKPEDRKAKLKQLLKSLKLQKEQLINEIRSLPKDDSINALISDLNSFSDSDEKYRKSGRHKKTRKDGDKSERKRRREESDTSNTSSDNVTQEQKMKVKDHDRAKHGRSPLKKMKKSRPRVLVLQNMSTQTTPKTSRDKSSTTSSSSDIPDHSQKQDFRHVSPKGLKICTKSHIPCDCNKNNTAESSEEVCKILIKLKENELPKVKVLTSARDKGEVSATAEVKDVQEKRSASPRKVEDRSPKSPSKEKKMSKSPEKERMSHKETTRKVETKSVATETEPFKQPLPKEPKKPKPTTLPATGRRTSPSRKSNESWKEHLSKNSMSTSSTSYLSPPDFSKPNTTASTEASKQSFYNLRKKPQQRNFHRSSKLRTSTESSFEQSIKAQDQMLLNYIKRLLSMSKNSIDELGMSSSDVSTPNQSIIELESNNPLAPLHNIIRFINLRAADLAKELSISPDVTPVPHNSAVSEDSLSKTQQDESQHVPEKDTTGSSSSKTKESVLSQYADVTDSCSKRIANLAAMIEKLREEKIEMLKSPPLSQRPDAQENASFDQRDALKPPDFQDIPVSDHNVTPVSDKDYSTGYLEFPPSGEKSKGSDSTASMDEEELNRRLLDIDMSLADKLKRFSQQKDEKSPESSGKSDKSAQDQLVTPLLEEQMNLEDREFLHRLQKLIEESHEKRQPSQRLAPELPTSTQSKDAPFVPLLIDIPKLPILEPQPEDQPTDLPVDPGKKYPPPSKGLITARKFNGNISLMPHELSTIIEADSQVSTRMSPNNSKTCTSLCKDTNVLLSPTLEEKSLSTDKSPNNVFLSKDTNLPISPTFEERSIPIDKPTKDVISEHSPTVSEHRPDGKVNNAFKSREKSRTLKAPPSKLVESIEKTESGEQPKSLKAASLNSKPDRSVEKTPKPLDFSDSSKSLSCTEATCTSLATSSGSNRFSSSSSSSDLASIEAMLKSIGMDWAIPTLHKTQEALALSSTSSSGDLSSKKKSRDKSISSSELSLKDFLKKQMLSKISSSSLIKSDASPASFLQECSEISEIQANSSAEKVRQRTSTPVLTSKSTTKEDQQQLFTGASDISSVRNSSCDGACAKSSGKQTFHTLGGEEELSTKSSVE